MILDEIVAYTYKRIETEKKTVSLSRMAEEAEKLVSTEGSFSYNFEKQLKRPEMSFICEVKKASPSKGIIAKDFPYVQISQEYQKAGADAISVLTEPKYFQGADEYLKEISRQTQLPTLRKDFVVDEYMIYQAKLLGASAVLLICAVLNREKLQKYIELAEMLGLSALVETHSADEIAAAKDAGAHIIGINNRDLQTFQVNLENSVRLRKFIPRGIICVSESGITTARDISRLKECEVDAVLIGETLMRCEDKCAMLAQLKGIKNG